LHGLTILEGIDILFFRIELVKTTGGDYKFHQFLDSDIVGEELGLL